MTEDNNKKTLMSDFEYKFLLNSDNSMPRHFVKNAINYINFKNSCSINSFENLNISKKLEIESKDLCLNKEINKENLFSKEISNLTK